MYNYIICAIFKNESHILKEWIEHYLYHGVDHIYLVNDFSTDYYMKIIKHYPDKVTLYHNDIITDQVGRQEMIMNKYFKSLLNISKWMSILDLDEFLYSPIDINLQNVIKKYEQFNSITVEWLFFGSNGHIEQPKSVVEGFTKRQYKHMDYINPHKFIVKCKEVVNFHIHHCDVNGPWTHLKCNNEHNSDFIINHYNIQSYNWFMNVKSQRGDINNYAENIGVKRDIEYFKKHDFKDVIDTKLLEQNQDLSMLCNITEQII